MMQFNASLRQLKLDSTILFTATIQFNSLGPAPRFVLRSAARIELNWFVELN